MQLFIEKIKKFCLHNYSKVLYEVTMFVTRIDKSLFKSYMVTQSSKQFIRVQFMLKITGLQTKPELRSLWCNYMYIGKKTFENIYNQHLTLYSDRVY